MTPLIQRCNVPQALLSTYDRIAKFENETTEIDTSKEVIEFTKKANTALKESFITENDYKSMGLDLVMKNLDSSGEISKKIDRLERLIASYENRPKVIRILMRLFSGGCGTDLDQDINVIRQDLERLKAGDTNLKGKYTFPN